MEEQMIFGALQTLNEEAFEDVIEEQGKNEILVATSVMYDNLRRASLEKNGCDEIDVVYLRSSPLLPHKIESCSSDAESGVPSVASGYSSCKDSAIFFRGSSLRGASNNHFLNANVQLKEEKCSLSKDKSDSTSLLDRIVPSSEQCHMRRDRPKSLNLNQERKKKYRKATNPENNLAKHESMEICELGNSHQSSLPDITDRSYVSKHLQFLSEEISARSASSNEMFGNKFHKIL